MSRPRRSQPPRTGGRALLATLTIAIGAVAAIAVDGRWASSAEGTNNLHEINATVGGPGPLGSVTFIGDSVGIGAGRFAPTLPDHLVARGWGPVRFHAVDGKRTGYPPGWPDHFNAVPMIDEWQAAGWDSHTWIVNLGANDSGYCRADVACARQAIMLVVDAIGDGHRIWWPKVTRFFTHQYQADAWNAALDQVAAERDDFWTWDWPAEMAANPDVYGSWDNTHLYPDGYRRRSEVMADAFTAAVGRTVRVGPDAALPEPVGGGSELLPVDPVRVVDTRIDAPGRLDAGTTVEVELSEHAPPGATAAAVSLVAVDPAGPGFLTAYPCGTPRPEASSVNYSFRTRAASAIIPLSTARSICVYTHAATDVIVDLQAIMVPEGSDASATRLRALDRPDRLVDTRETGRSRTIALPAPAGADAVAVNLTATRPSGWGFLAAFPCSGDRPLVSNVNFGPGDTIAGAAFVPVDDDGTFCVHASTDVDVIVDLTATLSRGDGLAFVPAGPSRLLDTRSAIGGWSPIHAADATIDVRVAPPGAEAVSGTVTIVQPVGAAFLRVTPCGRAAATSSVNALGGDVVANSATVGVSASGRICIETPTSTHTLFDVTGWWVAAP